MSYKGFHRAPTSERCPQMIAIDQGVVQCVRYANHPADLYGPLGHRFRVAAEFVHVCYRSDMEWSS